MRKSRGIIQLIICFMLLASVQSGMADTVAAKSEKIGNIIDKIEEAIHKNYTLADLLNLGEMAAETAADMPSLISDTVITANEQTLYAEPIDKDFDENKSDGDADDDGDGSLRPVYAVSGGRVLKSGRQDSLGMYVMVEHLSKISTYGHLSSIRVVEGERIYKGEMIGSYDSNSEKEFYYSLEDKC